MKPSDEIKLALADKSKPLRAASPARGFTCILCGAQQEPYTWCVRLPERLGVACVGCATDRGWTVR